ncbi:MAG: hypothetical protein EPO28_00890 [Saprospiraceae bacterium]|nr:MAG: hypothetical protein EPO28_00890 [Saprospiraceae bacterium]
MSVKLIVGLTACFYVLITPASSQDAVNKQSAFYWGGNIGITLYSYDRSGIATDEFYKANGEAGLSFLFPIKSKTLLRTGLEVSYKKSPYLNGISTYESFLDAPFLVSFLNIDCSESERTKSVNFLIGGNLSLLLEHGTAMEGDEVYELTENAFGNSLKLSLLSEISYNLFPKNTSKVLQSLGMRFGKDFEGLVFEFDEKTKPIAKYFTTTLFYSLLFSSKKQ